jgi:hypothetical protein
MPRYPVFQPLSAQMERDMKPIAAAYPRFHDFIPPQARIEAAEQDEKQIVIWSCFQHARKFFLSQANHDDRCGLELRFEPPELVCADGISRSRLPT